ncbi:putative ribonuclease H-like domain-containing protein, partial [Tanacetum coccineum]
VRNRSSFGINKWYQSFALRNFDLEETIKKNPLLTRKRWPFQTQSVSDNNVYAFMVENPNGSNVLHQDLEQIHKDDLEAMDLKWQLSLLSVRAKKYYQNTGKKILINSNDIIGYDKSKVLICSEMAEEQVQSNMALMAFSDSENSDKSLVKEQESQVKSSFVEGCGSNTSKRVSEVEPKKVRENNDALIIKDWVLDDEKQDESMTKPVKKTVIPTDAKIEKPVRKSVRYAEMYRSQRPRGNQRNWNGQNSNQLGQIEHQLMLPGQMGSMLLIPQHVGFGDLSNPIGKPQHDDKGFVDSGCSRHMTGNIAYLSDFKQFDGGYVAFGGGAYGGKISGKGTLKTANLDFEDVYFVNELKFNLFSVSQMCDKKNYVLFTDTECLVLSPNFKLPDENQILLKVPRKDNMYSFDMKNIVPKESLTCLVAKATLDESMLWHRRLGHINFKNINKLVKDNLVRGLPTKHFENDQTCVACLKGKQHRASCKSKVLNPITKPLFMLHMDLFGPTFVSSLMHKKYCLVVTDDYSRFTWVFFLTTKDETSEILKRFIKEIENLVDKKVKIIRSDNGTEFKNKVMDDFCREKGIKREYSVARTPQQNGVAERRNRTLIEAARTMLADSKLPTTFWAEAVSTACYVQFLITLQDVDNGEPKTADDAQKQVKDGPNNENTKQERFADDSSTKDVNAAGQHVNTASPDVNTGSLKLNDVGPSVNTASSNEHDSPEDMFTMGVSSTLEATHIESFSDEDEPETRRMTKPTSEQGFLSDVYEQKTHDTLNTCLYACFLSQIEPTSIAKALSDSSWVEAMQEELLQFKLQQVWILVDLPNGKKAIGTKWVFRNKKDERGIVIRNKARLVAQGHRQEEGIDYEEVFAPVARIEAIRLFLAYASFMGFLVYQMDVKSAFLYGTIEAEFYITQPPGFKDPDHPDKVYKVVKALYGLHQAPRAWYETLANYLLGNGFKRGKIDQTLFIKKQKGDILLVQVYVDDIIFGSTNKELCTGFEKLMKDKFQMSSMGELTFFLGLQVQQKEDGIFISQDKYVAEILKKFNYSDVKSASTPVDLEKPLVKDGDADDVDVHLYRSMIGSLMYLTASRPDIMFAANQTLAFGILGISIELVCFILIRDYVGATQDRKSTTGGCQFLGNRLISWQCKKQTVVATSTTEAEYVAAASCCGQVLWIQNQLQYEINMIKTEFEKLKQEKDAIDFKIEKFVSPPHPLTNNRPNKLDLSYSGLDEFKEPEFKGYGPENSKKESNVVSDDEEQDKSKTKPEKKTIILTFAKIEKPVKRSVRPRIVNTARSYRTPVNTVRPRVINTARQNRTLVNAARANRFNAGKPQHDDKGVCEF